MDFFPSSSYMKLWKDFRKKKKKQQRKCSYLPGGLGEALRQTSSSIHHFHRSCKCEEESQLCFVKGLLDILLAHGLQVTNLLLELGFLRLLAVAVSLLKRNLHCARLHLDVQHILTKPLIFLYVFPCE